MWQSRLRSLDLPISRGKHILQSTSSYTMLQPPGADAVPCTNPEMITHMKTFTFLLLLFAFMACLPAQSPVLPGMGTIYRQYDSLTQAGDHLAIARMVRQVNTDLQSANLHFYTASAYAKASQPDSALYFLELAIENGLINPNYVSSDPALRSLEGTPRWTAIQQRLEESRKRISSLDQFRFDISSIPSFFRTFKAAAADTLHAERYFSQYVLENNEGVRDYYTIRYMSPKYMRRVFLQEAPRFYEYLETAVDTNRIKAMEEETKAVFARFQELYPNAIFPPTYFVVGLLNSGGTLSATGLFIGVDMKALGPDMPTEELNDWQKSVITDYDDIPRLVAHELMHFQQNYRDTTDNLLRRSIGEGVCDFLTALCRDEPEAIMNRVYYEAHQEELWKAFRAEMHGNDSSKWLYNGDNSERPADLGYTMGHLISLGYYKRAKDKKQAIWELLNTEDFERIWKESGYAE